MQSPKSKKFRFTKKKIVLLAVLLAAAALIVRSFALASAAKKEGPSAACFTLGKTTLKDAVSVTGTLHSGSSANVYTMLTFPVARIPVSAGDAVKKGDVLAVLDSSSLEDQIRQQEYATTYADKSAALALAKAKSDYEDALYLYSNGLGADLTAAASSARTAESALQSEKEACASSQDAYEQGQISKLELNQAKAKLDQAQATYDSAQKSLTAARRTSQQSLLAARTAYEDAAAKSADKSAGAALDQLRKNLRDCVVTAPRDGVVTAVNAAVGGVPAGVMFKIEDPSDLIVDAELKEADTAKADPGDPVTVRTDATGEEVIAGEILSVAPAADPKTEGTGNVTFPMKVRVTGKNAKLKIGMRAKLTVTLEQKADVYAVPYEALADRADGGYAVYTVERQGDSWRVKAVPVTLGLQTDVSAEIAGPGLRDGLTVVASADGVTPGSAVRPEISASSASGGR